MSIATWKDHNLNFKSSFDQLKNKKTKLSPYFLAKEICQPRNIKNVRSCLLKFLFTVLKKKKATQKLFYN